jgi:hypothetical protein
VDTTYTGELLLKVINPQLALTVTRRKLNLIRIGKMEREKQQ